MTDEPDADPSSQQPLNIGTRVQLTRASVSANAGISRVGIKYIYSSMRRLRINRTVLWRIKRDGWNRQNP